MGFCICGQLVSVRMMVLVAVVMMMEMMTVVVVVVVVVVDCELLMLAYCLLESSTYRCC